MATTSPSRSRSPAGTRRVALRPPGVLHDALREANYRLLAERLRGELAAAHSEAEAARAEAQRAREDAAGERAAAQRAEVRAANVEQQLARWPAMRAFGA